MRAEHASLAGAEGVDGRPSPPSTTRSARSTQTQGIQRYYIVAARRRNSRPTPISPAPMSNVVDGSGVEAAASASTA